MRSELKTAQISATLTLSVSLEEIARVHFPENSQVKAQAAQAKRFREMIQNMRALEAAEANGPLTAYQYLQSKRPKNIGDLITRLSAHDVSGFYFLERIYPGDGPRGYVCLLREVTTVATEIASELAAGLTKTRWQEAYSTQHPSCLSFDFDDFGMPVSQFDSPTVEHIMQSFANLFGRIGLPDPIPEEIAAIIQEHTVALGAS